MSACSGRCTAKEQPANGPTPPPASMAIFLDLIALSRGLDRLADVLAEARRFLGLAQPHQPRGPNHRTVYRTLRAGCW